MHNGHTSAKPRRRRLRAVLDTNVFLAGLFSQGTLSARLYDGWVAQNFLLVTSPAIVLEVAHVLTSPHLQRRFPNAADRLRRFVQLAFRKAILTQDVYVTDRLTADPTDNKFLAAALEGKADYIVSRDPHLLNLKHFHAIQIVEPPAFVRAVRQQQQNRE
ncbi:MAG: putative toxin-antitoxin system toxin component, PIN family [Candidatus Binatia bacterium]